MWLMRSRRPLAALVLGLLCVGFGEAAAEPAKTKRGKDNASSVARTVAPAAPTAACARASYPGDPVCAWEDPDGKNLPTPSARAVRREIPDDVVINDKMSVGSADPVAMAKPPVQAANPYPVRKKEPVGGGAAVNDRV